MDNTFIDNECNSFTFEQVKEQIINYDFRCIIDFLQKLHYFENSAPQKRTYTKKTDSTKAIKSTMGKEKDKNISGIVVDINVTKNRKSLRGIDLIEKYQESNPNEFYIENINDFLPNLSKIKSGKIPTKTQIIVLINAIYKHKTFAKLKKAFNCADTTLKSYLTSLRKIGVLQKTYDGTIKLNDKLVIKKFYNSSII